MKFYRIIVSVMFCIVCTATMFEMEEEAIYIPKVILNLIDRFRANEDDWYNEIGHVLIKDKKREACNVHAVSCSQDYIWFSCSRFDHQKDEKRCFLSLSDMRFISEPCKNMKEKILSYFDNAFGHGLIKKCEGNQQLILKNEEGGKIGVFRGMQESERIGRLEAQEKLRRLSVSEDGQIIVTCGEGHIRKWELCEGIKKKFKMCNIYPGGKILVPALKYGIDQKGFKKDDVDTDE